MPQHSRRSLLVGIVVVLAVSALAQNSTFDGTWIGKYSDNSLAGYWSLELNVNGDSVTGQSRTASGKAGTIFGTIRGGALFLQIDQTTKSCPGTFKIELAPRDNSLDGEYSGGDCDGAKRIGHISLSHTDRYLNPTVLRADDGTFLPIDQLYVHGCAYWTVQTDRFFLGASATPDEGYTALSLYIVNLTDQSVTFDPDETMILDMVSRRFLKRYSSHEIDKKIYRSARLRAALAGFAAGLGSGVTETSKTQGDFTASDDEGNRYSGSVTGTMTTYTPSDGRASAAASNQVWRNAAARAARFDNTALLKHTILPGNTVMGFVFFSKASKGDLSQAAQLQEKGEFFSAEVHIGSENFRFPFPVDTFLKTTHRSSR